ncbi:MAG: GTP cyclohydrolase II [Xanthobacteraceae bacterium]
MAEFRSGRPVIITSEVGQVAAVPIDGMTDERLAAFRQLVAPARPYLVITPSRALALGLDAAAPVGIPVSDGEDAASILTLAADPGVKRRLEVVDAGANAGAAIELAKLAHRLPALLVADVAATVALAPFVGVVADAVTQFRRQAIASIEIAAEANVPLNGSACARFVIFRDAIGGSSTAIFVGHPDMTQPVPVRLHSACLTGDVFGSRRCDCGDQLRLAIRRLDEEGGGVILYLEQEGRGLGLANKMRTYKLQDAGFDTLDANTTLGFDDDERDYGVAVRMLQILGCTRVKLLTNNPAKLDGLTQAGIDVAGRIPLHGSVNSDNVRYLTAKATRSGHKLDHLLPELVQPAPIVPVSGNPAA